MREMPSDLAIAHVVREHPKILSLESDPPRDDRGMDVQLVRELDDGYRRRPLPHGARLPDVPRNRGIEGPFVRLGFLQLCPLQVEVLHEDGVLAAVDVPSDVRKLVYDAEPVVIDAVVAQGEWVD